MEGNMAKKKVFVSFDFDNDKTVKDFIVGQAKNPDSPFEISDHSLKEAAPEKDWLARAQAAIARADVFIIMLGPKTKNASMPNNKNVSPCQVILPDFSNNLG